MPEAKREHGLDALRVFAFLVLIFYHSGMGYVRWDWHVKNPQTSETLEYVMLFFNRWRLPLLFFISGAGVALSLRRRGLGEFAGERLSRLGIPLLVGMFLIVPPQIYFERIFRGAQFDSYWSFYRTVFEFVSYPKGSFSWHHLWFVAYVLVFALCSIPLFAALRRPGGVSFLERFAGFLEQYVPAIYLINVPNLLVGMTLGPHWPTTHNLTSDWANLTGTWMTFLWGYIFASNVRLLDILTVRRREFLIGGVLMAAVFFYLRATGISGAWSGEMRLLVSSVVSSYFGMCWIFALIGYARATIHSSNAFLRYATEAVYPFYIIHQTITVALVYGLIGWNVGVFPKLLVAASGTFAGSLLFYEVVRRSGPLRPLFGLKAAAGAPLSYGVAK